MMYRRKSLRIAGAAMLGTLVSLGAGSVSAAINLNDGMGKVKYAKETLVDNDANTVDVGGVKHYRVVGASNVLDLTVALKHFATEEESTYLRVDLTDLAFVAGLSIGANVSIAGGGTAGDDYGIFRLSPEAATAALPTVTITVNALAIRAMQDSDTYGDIRARLYDTLLAASNETDPFAGEDYMVEEAVGVVSGINEMAMPQMMSYPTAEVKEDFLKFVPQENVHTETRGFVGTFIVTYVMDVLAQDGTLVNGVEDLFTITGSTLELRFREGTGEFEPGMFSFRDVDTADNMKCNLATNEVVVTGTTDEDTKVTTATISIVELTGGPGDAAREFCIMVLDTNDEEIVAGRYTVTGKYMMIVERAFEPKGKANVLIGEVMHNGTTVHIPFVTTSLKQRIILTNRGSKDVTFNITVTQEAGSGQGTATDSLSDEMLPAGETRFLLSTDVVEFGAGNPRGSAVFTANAPPADISVSTSILGMWGGTDTVQHTKNRADGEL